MIKSYNYSMNPLISLQKVFESKTIKPNYKFPHVILTILFLGQSNQGIGRYRISDEIGLGEGSTKTLLNRLSKEGLISIESKQQGQILTNQGKEIYKDLLKRFSFPQIIQNSNNKYVIGNEAQYIIIKKEYVIITKNIGIEQRDEAIKIGGTGASVLFYNGQKMIFPDQMEIVIPIDYSQLKSGDVVVIGGGYTKNQAILATISATLSLISIN